MGKGVHVVCGADGQGLAISFGIVVCDKGVGRTTIAGRIAIGLWTVKGSNPLVFEGRFEIKGILEGLDLSQASIFGGSDTVPATIVNLCRGQVSRQNRVATRTPYLLSNIGGLPG